MTPGRPRRVVALGGGGLTAPEDAGRLEDLVVTLTGRVRPHVAFLPTASGDEPGSVARFFDAYARRADASWVPLFDRRDRDLATVLLAQDAIVVGGGNTANMLAIWRAQGVDTVLRTAWERGIVLAGVSAGAICWFSHGVTDSFGTDLARLDGALGLIAGSFCPHYDSEPLRRPRLHELVAAGLPAGWACDDGAALVFRDGMLEEAVAGRRGARAYRVELVDGRVVEQPLPTRYLGG